MIVDLSKITIPELYRLRAVINEKIEQVEKVAKQGLLDGRESKYFKLVQGRTSRALGSEARLVAEWKAIGLDANNLYNKKVKTVLEIEKLFKQNQTAISNHGFDYDNFVSSHLKTKSSEPKLQLK